MSNPQTRQDIIKALKSIQLGVTNDIESMSDAQFNQGSTASWSASDYLKHLLLSLKPVARVFGFPADRLQSQFGIAEKPSRTYDEVVAVYQKRLDEGVKAEDYEKVVPAFYRFPEGISDQRAYLIQSWNETNTRLIDAVDEWQDTQLDTLQIPHPAIGMTTMREMLFFTIFHNTLHWHDIQHAGGL